ncbi:hypothetical protein AB0M20_08530 [Actinoplanes sp. NPDC051633]|uniref:hypothetical protein n=1 Tax=Actinoplanes sp. NPDC051633 TaxID=3155670 RepID=UPI00342B9286
MRWMDAARRFGGLLWVAAGVVFQLVMLGRVRPGVITLILIAATVLLAAAVVTARGRPRRLVRMLGRLAAVLLALDFAGAVADRFGLFGTEGASWGSWDAFVSYTGRLLPFVPDSLVGVAAASATAGEIALAIWLVSGRQRRWAGKAAAGLLTVYLVAMGLAIGLTEVARFALPIQIGGALLVSAIPARRSAPAADGTPAIDAGEPIPQHARRGQ